MVLLSRRTAMLARSERWRGNPLDRGERSNVLPLAPGVRRIEERSGKASEGSGGGDHPSSSRGLRPDPGQGDPAGGGTGKLLSPARRRACIEHIRGTLSISERRACAALGQHRSTQRKIPRGRDDEAGLTDDIVELARQYGRYGYRKIAALLRRAGWLVNDKRVERVWRREGLKVPARQPKRARLWLNDGSCIRLRAERRNHVWSYDFVEDRTHDGRKIRMLNIIDEFTHEFVAKAVQDWIGAVGAKTAYITPGSPWENGFIESFNARLRDELLDGEIL